LVNVKREYLSIARISIKIVSVLSLFLSVIFLSEVEQSDIEDVDKGEDELFGVRLCSFFGL